MSCAPHKRDIQLTDRLRSMKTYFTVYAKTIVV